MKCGQKWSWEAVLEGLAECLPALAQRGGRVPTRFQPLRRFLTAFPLPLASRRWRHWGTSFDLWRLLSSHFRQHLHAKRHLPHLASKPAACAFRYYSQPEGQGQKGQKCVAV